MNTPRQNLEKLARSLRTAYGAVPIAPLSPAITGATDQASIAYEIQNINTQFWLKQGREIVGYKIGLTSPAVQKQLGVSEPDYGILFDDMIVAQGGVVNLETLTQPKIEAEIGFRVARDLTQAPEDEAALARYLDTAFPALEIVDSRIKDWKITLADTVADNASSALYVLGEGIRLNSTLNLVQARMEMYEDDKFVSSGSGADCLRSPLTATLWLVRKMIEVGRVIKAGDIILSGALGPMVTVKPNKKYHAKISDIGDVAVKFKLGRKIL